MTYISPNHSANREAGRASILSRCFRATGRSPSPDSDDPEEGTHPPIVDRFTTIVTRVIPGNTGKFRGDLHTPPPTRPTRQSLSTLEGLRA